MTRTLEPVGADADFSIITRHCDTTSAELHLLGVLDDGAAALLRAIIDMHVRDGRRFLRLDVGRVTAADRAGVRLLSELHRHLLDQRGTLILTGVTTSLQSAFTAANADLFVLAPTAADRLR